jgi:hypothetical protein
MVMETPDEVGDSTHSVDWGGDGAPRRPLTLTA